MPHNEATEEESGPAVWGIISVISRELHQTKDELRQTKSSLDDISSENRMLRKLLQEAREECKTLQNHLKRMESGENDLKKQNGTLKTQGEARMQTGEKEARLQVSAGGGAHKGEGPSKTQQQPTKTAKSQNDPQKKEKQPGTKNQGKLPQPGGGAAVASGSVPLSVMRPQSVFAGLPQYVPGAELPKWDEATPCIISRSGQETFEICKSYLPLYVRNQVMWTNQPGAPSHALLVVPYMFYNPFNLVGQEWVRNDTFRGIKGKKWELFCDLSQNDVYYVGTYEGFEEVVMSYSDEILSDSIRSSVCSHTMSFSQDGSRPSYKVRSQYHEKICAEYASGIAKVVALQIKCVGWNRRLYAQLVNDVREKEKKKEEEVGKKRKGSPQDREVVHEKKNAGPSQQKTKKRKFHDKP